MTNAEVVSALEDAKGAFQDAANAASGTRVMQLMTVIHQLADEIGQIEAQDLDDGEYVPQTDAFQAETADAAAFIAQIQAIKSAFATVIAIAKGAEQVLHVLGVV